MTSLSAQDIGDRGGPSMRAASFCALAMAGAIWWLSRLAPSVRHESIVMLVPAITAAFGPFFLVSGVRSRLRLRRYGRSTIAIEPPRAGLPLRGVIRSERRVPAVARYTIRLRCEDVQGRTIATTLFKGLCHVPHLRIDSVHGIPFAIEPAGDVADTGLASRLAAEKLHWWIDVYAEAEVIAYAATFDITPLLATAEAHGNAPWWLDPAQGEPTAMPDPARLQAISRS